MFQATKAIQEAFAEANLKCRVEEAGGMSMVKAGVSGKQTTYSIHFISSDDDNDVASRVMTFVKTPEEKRPQVLEAINECNRKFRFLKFVIDKDNDVNVEADIPLRVTNVGPVAVELTIRIMKILDEAYPIFMKCIWC